VPSLIAHAAVGGSLYPPMLRDVHAEEGMALTLFRAAKCTAKERRETFE